MPLYLPQALPRSSKTADFNASPGLLYQCGVSGADVTASLPAVVDDVIDFSLRSVSGAYKLILDPNGSDTIEGLSSLNLHQVWDFVRLQGDPDNSQWIITQDGIKPYGSVTVHTGNGTGSTNTNFRRFTTSSTVGTAISYADNASTGASFTILEAGLYEMVFSDLAGSVTNLAIGKNASNSGPSAIPMANRLGLSGTPANTTGTTVAVERLEVNDVIRAIVGPGTPTDSSNLTRFHIHKIGN